MNTPPNPEPLVLTIGQFEAMNAIFELQKAVCEHDLSIADLEHVVRAALAHGHDRTLIVLTMARIAVERASQADAAAQGEQK